MYLRRQSNLILNLFGLMVDASVPDIALEPDKTVKKVQVGTVSSSPGYAPGPDLEKTLKFNSSEDHNSKKNKFYKSFPELETFKWTE